MIKPEFSDFYKFCTSFGIILILSGIFVSLFIVDYGYETAETFLKDYSPEKLAEKGYTNQTINAFDSLYASKLKNVNDIIKYMPWLSLLLIIIGGILFYYGLFKWWVKQKKIDDLLDIEVSEKSLNIKQSELNIKQSELDLEEKEVQRKEGDLRLRKRRLILEKLSKEIK
jgi:hypothetical protein